MKDKLVKRRNHINWNEVRLHLEDNLVNARFNYLKCITFKISDNRLSYWALLHVYDKNVLDMFRHTKDFEVFSYV